MADHRIFYFLLSTRASCHLSSADDREENICLCNYISFTPLILLLSIFFLNQILENLDAVQPGHQSCAGANPASRAVPWEQLGRIGVSLAAYKGLTDVRVLEQRSYELSTGSANPNPQHCILYVTHHTHCGEWPLVKVDGLNECRGCV